MTKRQRKNYPEKMTPTLIYIMGRRYCGSTVLSAMLNAVPAVQGVGELIEGKGDRAHRYCSCGAPIQDCDFLCEVCERFEEDTGKEWDEAAERIKAQSDPRQFLSTFFETPDSEKVRTLRRINDSMTRAVAQAGGTPFVLDASKECARGLFLARFMTNVKIIHLVRNPEGLAASQLRRMKKGHGFSVLGREFQATSSPLPFVALSGLNWTLEYLLGELVRQVAPAHVLRVRYEDLCSDPRRELERIARFTGIDMQGVIQAVESGEEIPFGHSFAGNHRRTEGSFVFRPDRDRKKALGRRHRALTRLLCWPLMMRHGYRLWR